MQDRSNEHESRGGDLLRYAVVDAVDLGAMTVVVRLGAKRLGPMPWFMPRAGETVVWSPPSVDEQGLVLCPEGDSEAAVFLPGVCSSKHAAPAGDARHLVVTFKDGAVVAYDPAAHLLSAVLPDGGRADLTVPGGLHVTGPITCSETVTAAKDLVSTGGDVKAGAVSLRGHKHLAVQPGSGVSGPPAGA